MSTLIGAAPHSIKINSINLLLVSMDSPRSIVFNNRYAIASINIINVLAQTIQLKVMPEAAFGAITSTMPFLNLRFHNLINIPTAYTKWGLRVDSNRYHTCKEFH